MNSIVRYEFENRSYGKNFFHYTMTLLLESKFRKTSFYSFRNLSRSSFPCKELKDRSKTIKFVRFVTQDGISPFILLFCALKYCSWVVFTKDNGISLPTMTQGMSKESSDESLPQILHNEFQNVTSPNNSTLLQESKLLVWNILLFSYISDF